MSLVCLDSQIIQWGLFKRYPQSSKAVTLITQATAFIEWLEKGRHEVILPSIVLGEILSPVPRELHVEIMSQISREWMIANYDSRAAKIFAGMRYDADHKQIIKDIQAKDPCATRKQLNADGMIIATAIANNVNKLYSYDSALIRMARAAQLDAEDFMTINLQYKLFSQSENQSEPETHDD
jgi:predicted nucleic acid-binding protein